MVDKGRTVFFWMNNAEAEYTAESNIRSAAMGWFQLFKASRGDGGGPGSR